MEPHEKVNRSKKEIFINNFIGGVAWGLGSIIGFTIIFAIIGSLISKIDFVPIIGEFVQDVVNNVLQRQNPLLK